MRLAIAIALTLAACGTTAPMPPIAPTPDTGADVTPDAPDAGPPLALGCYLEHDGRTLAYSRIADDGQSGCCDYWSRDYQQLVTWCTDSQEIEEGAPFFLRVSQ